MQDDMVVQFRASPNIFVDYFEVETLLIKGVDEGLFKYLKYDRVDCKKCLTIAESLSNVKCNDEGFQSILDATSKAIYHLLIKLIDVEKQRQKLEEKLIEKLMEDCSEKG